MIAVQCACSTSNTCEYHARQPKPCPSCHTGTIERYSGKDGQRYVPFVLGGRFGLARVKHYPDSRPFWACNFCEYCE